MGHLPLNDNTFEQREQQFTSFVANDLADFWRMKQEWLMTGCGGVTLQCVKVTSKQHNKAIVVVSGFMETYLKYAELLYDLFQAGYDVYMFDHRGQGLSERMLVEREKVYVEQFSDYVDDLATFWQQQIESKNYQQRYLLGHSMGGAISTLFLARQPKTVTAAVLSAPMCGVALPMPRWAADKLLKVTESRPQWRVAYAVRRRKPFPFVANVLTHSKVRYQRFIEVYQQHKKIHLYGPTFHWVSEALSANKQILSLKSSLTIPVLILQAEKDKLVDNQAQISFYQQQMCYGNRNISLQNIHYSRHEILFERDDIRQPTLMSLFTFFQNNR